MADEYTDREIEELKDDATVKQKVNRVLKDVRGIKDRLDNGMSEQLARNSWAIKIIGTIVVGLLVYMGTA